MLSKMILYFYGSAISQMKDEKFSAICCVADGVLDFIFLDLVDNKGGYLNNKKLNNTLNSVKQVARKKICNDWLKSIEEEDVVGGNFSDFICLGKNGERVSLSDVLEIKYCVSQNNLYVESVYKPTNTKAKINFIMDDESKCDLSDFSYTIEKKNKYELEKENKQKKSYDPSFL